MKNKIRNLPLDIKCDALSGVGGWNTLEYKDVLKGVSMSDGPHGLRIVYEEIDNVQKAYKNNAYPTLSAIANSWNRDVAYDVANSIGDDCVNKNVNIILGPGVNIKRTPLCGRNFEYFSEDPFLAGTLAASYIKGVQEKGVGACLKHFACNNREYDRFYQNSEVDERTLHEIYYRPFEIAIREAKPWSMMCSYNPLNGIYTSESYKLLTEVARKEFGFDGYMISDWGSVRNRAKSLKAGIDLAMPFDPYFKNQLKEALNNKFIDEETLNTSLFRLNDLVEKVEENKNKFVSTLSEEDKDNIAIKAAEESIILLENKENILPLKDNGEKVAVIGSFAINPAIGGEGSAKVVPNKKDLNLVNKLKENCTNDIFDYEQAYIIRYNLIQPSGYKNAIKLAAYSDKVILCVGNNDLIEKEETDRYSISLNPQVEDLINKISSVNDNVILVVYAGGVINLEQIKDKVKAILFAGYNGQGVNDALANIIAGKVSPSGKTSETFIKDINDSYCKDDYGDSFSEVYREGVLVGYRYYEKFNIDVTYPFGYGMTYTDFEYSNLKIKKISELDYEISYDIKNIGSKDAKEVSQIYVGNELKMVSSAKKELVEYSKDLIKSKESKTIKKIINQESFRYFNTMLNSWYVENGRYYIYIGSSSRDIKLKTYIDINLDNYCQYSNR